MERLADEQRDTLAQLLRTDSHPAAILLKADADDPDAWTDEEATDHLETTRLTVQRVRQQLSVLARECLDYRIPDRAALVWDATAWDATAWDATAWDATAWDAA